MPWKTGEPASAAQARRDGCFPPCGFPLCPVVAKCLPHHSYEQRRIPAAPHVLDVDHILHEVEALVRPAHRRPTRRTFLEPSHERLVALLGPGSLHQSPHVLLLARLAVPDHRSEEHTSELQS